MGIVPYQGPQQLRQGFNPFGRIVSRVKAALASVEKPSEEVYTFASDMEARQQYIDNYGSMASWVYEKLQIEAGRMAAYRDFDLMDAEFPEVSTALDVISEYATQSDDAAVETFNIECDDQKLADLLNAKANILGLRDYVTPLAREVAKYGGTFLELIASEQAELVKTKPLRPHQMERMEDEFGNLEPVAFVQHDKLTDEVIARFASWQIEHFRYMKSCHGMYGDSYLLPTRRVMKQIGIMEDGMVIGRVYRSHVRYAIYVPTDGMSATAREEYLERLKQKYKKKERLNPVTGQIENMAAPMLATEDFWIGTTEKSAGRVDVLQGAGNLSNIGDVEHFQNKVFAALKVPKAIIGFERDVNAKSTLTQQDVNFARSLRRLQQVMASGIKDVLMRALVLDGIKADPESWNLVFPPISTVDELRNWQVMAAKAQVASILYQQLHLVDEEYVLKKILELDPDEVKRLMAYIKDQQDKAKEAQAQMNNPLAALVRGGQKGLPPGDKPFENPKNAAGAEKLPKAAISGESIRPEDVVRRVRRLLSDDARIVDSPVSRAERNLGQTLIEFAEEFGGLYR